MMGNYFFIDGSALLAQIRTLWRADTSFRERKLCPKKMSLYFMNALVELHSGTYRRFTFYFPVGDEANVADHLLIPDHRAPGEVRDLNFKFCGQKLKGSAEFTEIVENYIPEKFRNRVGKSEKGIDIEICCDALKLAAGSKLDRLFLLTNDDDFLPLCRTVKEYGANVSVIHLTDRVPPNTSLLRETDSYDVIPLDELKKMFLPLPGDEKGVPVVEPAATAAEAEAPSALKPEAEPSALSAVSIEDEG